MDDQGSHKSFSMLNTRLCDDVGAALYAGKLDQDKVVELVKQSAVMDSYEQARNAGQSLVGATMAVAMTGLVLGPNGLALTD